MPWVKLDDRFPDHGKLADCGVIQPLCGWLYVCGLAFCNRQLTDGRIPKAHIVRLVSTCGLGVCGGDEVTPTSLAHRLVQVGLWEDAGDAYVVHDYLTYQPSRADVLKARAENATRVEQWRQKRPRRTRNAVGNSITNAITNAVTNGVCTDTPDPNKKDQEIKIPASPEHLPVETVENSSHRSAVRAVKGTNTKALIQVARDVLDAYAADFADADIKDATKAKATALGLTFTPDSLRKALDAAEAMRGRERGALAS